MDSESPPAKRQRTDDEAPDSPLTITRVPSFWFEEGNIILQIESKQYRVHKSILSMHSNVFKGLFQLPQPENEPLIEGCQIVQLTGDSAQDMEHVLSLLYYCFIVHDLQKNLCFPTIASIIRLGRKYEFIRLQATALRRLQFLFPKSFVPDWIRGNPQFTPEFLIDVVNLAEENSINSILPAAYLQDAIVNGVQRKDGTEIKLNYHSMVSCILGREKLASQLPRLIFPSLLKEPSDDSMDLTPSEGCPKRYCTIPSIRATRAAFLVSLEGSRMKFLQKPETMNELSASLCGECKKSVVNEYMIGRKSIWDQLPTYFGLPNWDDLKDF